MTTRRYFLRQSGILGVSPLIPKLMDPLSGWEPYADATLNDDDFFALIRRQLLLPSDRIYLNTGSLGPSPVGIVDLVHATMRSVEMNPAIENWGTPGEQMEMVREIVANYINASKEDVLLTRNTTEGLSLVAQSVHLQPGDEILTTDQEHGGAMVGLEYTAANQGATVRKMSLDMPSKSREDITDQIRAQINDHTKMILLSHVNTITGLVMPLEKVAEITKPKGIILVADGAQAPGQIAVDVKTLGVHAYATSGHKWLLGPKETGFLYVAPDFRSQLHSAFSQSGFASYSASSGTRNVATIIGMGAAIEWQQEIGVDRISQRCLEIRNYCLEELSDLSGIKVISPSAEELSCGIVSFTLDHVKNTDVSSKLKEQDIIVKVLPGINGNRISCHMFVSKKDIDRFVQVLHNIVD